MVLSVSILIFRSRFSRLHPLPHLSCSCASSCYASVCFFLSSFSAQSCLMWISWFRFVSPHVLVSSSLSSSDSVFLSFCRSSSLNSYLVLSCIYLLLSPSHSHLFIFCIFLFIKAKVRLFFVILLPLVLCPFFCDSCTRLSWYCCSCYSALSSYYSFGCFFCPLFCLSVCLSVCVSVSLPFVILSSSYSPSSSSLFYALFFLLLCCFFLFLL